MGASDYVKELRRCVGHRLVLLPGVAAVIRDARGRILLQHRADNGQWGFPAGAIDPGETPAEAIVREVREETGLDVRPARILGVIGGRAMRITYPNGDETEYVGIVFACEITGGTLRGEDDESLGFGWFAPEDVPRSEGFPYPRELIDRATDEAWFQR